MIAFTDEELALLTPFDMVAHDYMRKSAVSEGSTAPCWLCCSEEARAEARGAVRQLFSERVGRALTVKDIEWVAAQQADLLERWRAAELAMKKERASGNPRAFFT